MLKAIILNLSDSISMSDGFSKAVTYNKLLSDTVSLIDSIAKAVSVGKADGVSLSDSIAKSSAINLADIVNLSDVESSEFFTGVVEAVIQILTAPINSIVNKSLKTSSLVEGVSLTSFIKSIRLSSSVSVTENATSKIKRGVS